jgi:hypothetical protein
MAATSRKLIHQGDRNKIANKERDVAELTLVLESEVPLRMQVQESVDDGSNRFRVTTRPDGITQWRVMVTQATGQRHRESIPVTFRLLDARGRTVTSEQSVFLGPK